MVLKSKFSQIYLDISRPVNLEALRTSLTLIGFKVLHLKSIFRQIGPKFKTLPDLLENVCFRNLEGAECRSNMDIQQYFIQNLNLVNLKPKPQISLETKISQDLLEILFTSQYLKVIITNLASIIEFFLKYEFWQVGPKIKASLNLHEYQHTG